jgi:hypothetical protein
MANTTTDSASTSPTDTDIEKADFVEPALNQRSKEEEIELTAPHDDAETSIARPKEACRGLALHQTRSRSSIRSQRSYAGADGYTHFEHDDDDAAEKHAYGTREGSEEDESKAFEVQWKGAEDPSNPKSTAWGSMAKKWSIVIILAMSSMCVTCASALYVSTYAQIEHDFHISREVATLGLSIFVCGLGLGPMFLSPLSEFYGRRPIYLCAFGMYLIWLIPCAVANNVATMLVSRFFDGLAGSAFLSVAGGTVGDMFPKEKLSMPMVIYTASPFVGPLVR